MEKLSAKDYINEYRQTGKIGDLKGFKKSLKEYDILGLSEYSDKPNDIRRLYHVACSHISYKDKLKRKPVNSIK